MTFDNELIDILNKDKENFVILQPGEVWTPGVMAEAKIEDSPCNVHIWHTVTLFSTTVQECKKCGKLRDE